MTTTQIQQEADRIINHARQLAAGPGRANVGPSSSLTDGRNTYTASRDSFVNGRVAAASFIDESTSRGSVLLEALYSKGEAHDAASAAFEKLEAACVELGIRNLVNL